MNSPSPGGPLVSPRSLPACLLLAGALRGRCTVGSRPPLSGPLPEGCGFTWGQLWGHRSCHQLLQAAQGPRSAGLGQGGQDSSPAAFRGDGGPPLASLPHTELQAGLALPFRVKTALAKKEEAVSSLRKQHEVGLPGASQPGGRGRLGPDQDGRRVAGRAEAGRPPGGAAGAAQAAVPKHQVTSCLWATDRLTAAG